MVVVSTLLRNHCGVILDFSFAKFHEEDVLNWIQNKSRHKPFVNAIPKLDILIHEDYAFINVDLIISLSLIFYYSTTLLL